VSKALVGEGLAAALAGGLSAPNSARFKPRAKLRHLPNRVRLCSL